MFRTGSAFSNAILNGISRRILTLVLRAIRCHRVFMPDRSQLVALLQLILVQQKEILHIKSHQFAME